MKNSRKKFIFYSEKWLEKYQVSYSLKYHIDSRKSSRTVPNCFNLSAILESQIYFG